MCGIAGAISNSNQTDTVNKMSLLQKHRGPDESYRWNDAICYFALERLSICDVNNGIQPYFNEDKTIAVIFNGEIFNHGELRLNLEKNGHKFESDHCDGEVIPHLYEEYGLEFPNLLDGMFSIALWNAVSRELILVRDHFGIKPLYFTLKNNSIFFASELKTFSKNKSFDNELNYSEIGNYFKLGHTASPNTIYQNIRQLEPATMLIYSESNLKHYKYWIPTQKVTNFDFESNTSLLLGHLERSIKTRLESDVDVATMLSGGLDSSAVTALASSFSNKRLKTFNLFYPEFKSEGKHSDYTWAKELAKKLETDHHEIPITHSDLKNALVNIIDTFAEPFAGVVSTYFISEHISKYCKVALTGDGSDEIFGSYFYPRLASILDSGLPYDKSIQTYLGITLSEFSALSDQKCELERRIKGMKILDYDVSQFYSSDFKSKLSNNSEWTAEYRNILKFAMTDFDKNKSRLDEALWMDFHELLPNEVLAFTDRLSMAWSLELRPVYLTKQIYELSLSIPSDQKIRLSVNKFILKKSVEKILPKDLIYRKKEGFVLPIAHWLSSELRLWALEILHPNRTQIHGLWKSREVYDFTVNYKSPDFRRAKLIWKFIVFQLWWESNLL